jgi:integrase
MPTTASVIAWRPNVVQRVLGHASAAMTMDLYGHQIDRNLWDVANRLGATTGHPRTRDRR